MQKLLWKPNNQTIGNVYRGRDSTGRMKLLKKPGMVTQTV